MNKNKTSIYRQIYTDPVKRKIFENIVEKNGQDKSWASISRQLHIAGITANSSMGLKYTYQKITNPYPIRTPQERAMLLKIFMEHGDSTPGQQNKVYAQILGKEQPLHLKYYIHREVLLTLKNLSLILSTKKQFNMKFFVQEFKLPAFKRFLLLQKVKSNDAMIAEYSKSLQILKQLFDVQIKYIEADRTTQFHHFRKIISRHKLDIILQQVQYMNFLERLRQSNHKKSEKWYRSNPYFKQPAELNTNSQLYQIIFDDCNCTLWYRDYQKTLALQHDEQYVVNVDMNSKKTHPKVENKNQIILNKDYEREVKTKRGRIVTKDQNLLKLKRNPHEHKYDVSLKEQLIYEEMEANTIDDLQGILGINE